MNKSFVCVFTIFFTFSIDFLLAHFLFLSYTKTLTFTILCSLDYANIITFCHDGFHSLVQSVYLIPDVKYENLYGFLFLLVTFLVTNVDYEKRASL